MIPGRVAVPVVVLLAGAAAPAAAQFGASVDLGAGSYRSDGSLSGTVASLAPSVRFEAGPLHLDAAGVYTDAPAGRWNFQGTSRAILTSPRLWILRAEAAGMLDWTSHRRVDGTTVLSGELRAYAHPFRGSAVWAGHARGRAWSLGDHVPVRRSQAGASAGWGGVQVGVTLATTSYDTPGSETPFAGVAPIIDVDTAAGTGGGPRRGERSGFTDAMLWGRWSHRALDVDLSVGRRFSRSTPEVLLWSVSAARTVVPGLALVAAAGRAGSDPVTALPGSRYIVLGLRLQVGRAFDREREREPRGFPRAGFRVGPSGPAGREITLHAPDAGTMELAGDFTDWQPVAFEREGESEWRIVLPIAPGLHRVVVRADGGTWVAPPGTRPVPSEFGGEVGEFAVE
ncbi:MAG TPA: glycogen-binding domain-containing protein [Gemmatimonadales bacterium]|nr:glycogen-binding domain-containing protein [Gemmatimonadales bacterium]